MKTSLSPYNFGVTQQVVLAAAANFTVAAASGQNLLSLSGAPANYDGPLAVLISNVGAAAAQFVIQSDQPGTPALAVVGHQLKNDPSNPILIDGMKAGTKLWLRSAAGTTVEFQVGYVRG